MNQEEQGKKTSPAEKLPAGKDDKAPVPGKPTDLSDEDLDNVAGGAWALVFGGAAAGIITKPTSSNPSGGLSGPIVAP